MALIKLFFQLRIEGKNEVRRISWRICNHFRHCGTLPRVWADPVHVPILQCRHEATAHFDQAYGHSIGVHSVVRRGDLGALQIEIQRDDARTRVKVSVAAHA